MFRSIIRNTATGEFFVRGTQLPVDFVFDLLDEGYPVESIARALAEDRQDAVVDAVHTALLFPEAFLGSAN